MIVLRRAIKSVPNFRDRNGAPASTTEGRESEIISLAYDLAEKQIRDGTAPAQVLTHFLKLGSAREKLEREILIEQRKLLQAKTDRIESDRRVEELYNNAIAAMMRYGGDQNSTGANV